MRFVGDLLLPRVIQVLCLSTYDRRPQTYPRQNCFEFRMQLYKAKHSDHCFNLSSRALSNKKFWEKSKNYFATKYDSSIQPLFSVQGKVHRNNNRFVRIRLFSKYLKYFPNQNENIDADLSFTRSGLNWACFSSFLITVLSCVFRILENIHDNRDKACFGGVSGVCADPTFLIGQLPQVVTNVVNIRSTKHVRHSNKEHSKMSTLKLKNQDQRLQISLYLRIRGQIRKKAAQHRDFFEYIAHKCTFHFPMELIY